VARPPDPSTPARRYRVGTRLSNVYIACRPELTYRFRKASGLEKARNEVYRRLTELYRSRMAVLLWLVVLFSGPLRPRDARRLVEMRAAARNGEARRRRLASGLTQAELGAVCGVSGPAIARWEHGDRVPRGEAALRYARFLASLDRERVAG
jgi:DNA-binding XRE family transcriptional regulator